MSIRDDQSDVSHLVHQRLLSTYCPVRELVSQPRIDGAAVTFMPDGGRIAIELRPQAVAFSHMDH